MGSNKENLEILKLKNSKKNFCESKLISEHNKKLVEKYISSVTLYRSNKSTLPYSMNSNRYNILKKVLETIWKDKKLDEIDYKDVEDLACAFDNNEIQNENNGMKKPYSLGYKQQFCKIINSFFINYYGRDKSKADNIILNEVGKKILNINPKKYSEKPTLSYEETKKLVENSPKIKTAYYFATLFGGGFRIEEFLNIRFKDIEKQKGEKQEFYTFHVTQGTKTGKTRRVNIFLFTEIIKEYLTELKNDENYNEDNFVFKGSQQSCNKLIKKALKDKLHYSEEKAKTYHNHSMRHSSATYYATNISKNDTDLYKRFGWSYGSDEAKEYVMMIEASQGDEEKSFRKSNIHEETKIHEEKLNFQSKEIDELKRQNKDTIELFDNLKNELEYIKQQQEISKILYRGIQQGDIHGTNLNLENPELIHDINGFSDTLQILLKDSKVRKAIEDDLKKSNNNDDDWNKLTIEEKKEIHKSFQKSEIIEVDKLTEKEKEMFNLNKKNK